MVALCGINVALFRYLYPSLCRQCLAVLHFNALMKGGLEVKECEVLLCYDIVQIKFLVATRLRTYILATCEDKFLKDDSFVG